MADFDQSALSALWDQRAEQYGRRAVLDLAIPENEFESFTDWQRDVLRPHVIRTYLDANRPLKRILDFGCGSGRFTNWLAEGFRMLEGLDVHVTGFDPSPAIVARAPAPAANVIYASGDPDAFFLRERANPFDLVWITLVLGGIPDSGLPKLADSLTDLLAPGGALLLAEHTDPALKGNDFWHFRPVDFYVNLFPKINLARAAFYETRGTTVSIFTGTKRP